MTTVLIEERRGTSHMTTAPPSGMMVSGPASRDRETVGLRILLADDHRMVRKSVRALLEKEGFEVVGEAGDGREAVRLAQQCRPDMVILDVSMPALNGLAAAGEILRDAPQTRAILLTLHSEYSHVRTAFRAGVRGYVVKTHMPDDLLPAIREVAHGRTYISPTISGTAGPPG